MVVYDTADSAEEELGTLQVIGSQVDAVVGYFSRPEQEIDLLTRGIPVVLIGRAHETARFSSIRVDGRDGVHAAVAHLVARGHERIGMLDHDGRAEPSVRREWFGAAAAALGVDADAVVGSSQSAAGGGEALESLLILRPDITAVSPSTTSSRWAHCARRAAWAGASRRTSW